MGNSTQRTESTIHGSNESRFMAFSRILLILMVIFSSSAISYADDFFDGTTFTISGKVNLPVYVKINGGGTLTINQRYYTTPTKVQNASSITDANGNRCIYHQSYEYRSGVGTHYNYEITGVYSTSGSSYQDNSSSGYSSSSSSSAAQIGSNLANSVMWGSRIHCDGHPYLSLGVGMSRSVGEFARLKFVTGGVAGLVLSGSIGKDWIFNTEYNDKTCWNAGMGIRFGDPNNDISVNMLLGHTPWHPKMALMMNLEYEHFFGEAKRFGVFGTIGFAATGLDKDSESKCHFDFMVGCAIKLWQK